MHLQTGQVGICIADMHLQTGHVGICTADTHLRTGHVGICTVPHTRIYRHHVPQTRTYMDWPITTPRAHYTPITPIDTPFCLQKSTDLLRNADRLTCRPADHSIDANPQASFTAADTRVIGTII